MRVRHFPQIYLQNAWLLICTKWKLPLITNHQLLIAAALHIVLQNQALRRGVPRRGVKVVLVQVLRGQGVVASKAVEVARQVVVMVVEAVQAGNFCINN